MKSPAGFSRVLRFGAFEVDLRAGELHKHGLKIKLQDQPFQILAMLLAQAGEVVTREELRQKLWPADTFVDFDHGLNNAIKRLREALGDSADSPRYIETLRRRGYRLIVPVDEVGTGLKRAPTLSAVGVDGDPGAPGTKDAALLQQPRTLVRIGHRRFGLRYAVAVAGGAIATVALIVLLGTNLGGWRDRLLRRPRAGPIHSIAVLPLENLSRDPDQEYFSDGMTDALITDLAQIGSLKVISRTSSMQYKQTKKSLRAIARELSVDGVVEGTVQRSGDRVRITAQLIEAPNDRHLWAKTYEGDLRSILALESEFARSIAKEVEIQLTPEQRSRLAKAPQINGEAYELYLKGRYFWNKRDAEGLKKALDHFQRAAEKEPGYAPVHAGLADTYSLLGAAGYDVLPAPVAMEKARAAARKALLIDDALAEAHASLGFVIHSYDWDWFAAEKEYKRAIALNPNYATAHQWYSEWLVDLGRKEEALGEAQAALALDPLSLIVNENIARVHYFARHFDQATEGSRKTLEMDSDFPISHLRLGRAYAANGMYPEAIKEFQEFVRLSGNIPLATASIGNALARSGHRCEAIHALHELTLLSKQKRVPAICFVLVHAGLGDNSQAIAWLEEAYKERSDFLLVLKVDPLFDPLRSDPRFKDLVHRVGLPQDGDRNRKTETQK